MTSPPTATDELIEFISDLHRSGFNIGTEQFVSAHRLLCALIAESDSQLDPQRFGEMLSPVLCSNTEEQDSFPEHYERWLNTKPAIFHVVEDFLPAPTPLPKPIPRPESKRSFFSWMQHSWFAISVITVTVGGIIALLIFLISNTSFPLQTGGTAPQNGAVSRLPSWETTKWVIIVVSGIIVLGGVLVWLFRFKVRLELKRLRSRTVQRVDELKVKGASDQLIQFLPLRRIAQGMRRHRPFEETDLNVPKTIEETIRAGIFTPAFTSRKALPEYLVLIDRATVADQQAQLVAKIVDHLDKNDVLIEQYFFREDPRICWKEGREAQFLTIEELALRHPRHYLLIFSDGDGFFDPLAGRPYRWLEEFTAWPTRLLLTSEVKRGDFRDWILAELGFRVLPSTRAGLTAISESIDGGLLRQNGNSHADPLPVALRERTGHWLKSYPPPPESINELCSDLKKFLGDEGYYWLTACAVYPLLYLDLTFYLGFMLISQENLFDTYSQLVRLPWFRSGSMPDWLRARLVMELDAKSEQTIRVVLEDLFIESLKRPDGFVLPVVKAPKEVAESFSGWSRLKAKARALYRAKQAEEILRKQLDDNSLRDYVALSFMSGRKPSRLAVTLPQELYPVLYGADAPMITRTGGWLIIIVNFFLSTIFVVPLMASPVGIPIAVVVWITLIGLTFWSVRELRRAGPVTSSSSVTYAELLRKFAGAATRNSSRWIGKHFLGNQETDDIQEADTTKTILDPSPTEPLGPLARTIPELPLPVENFVGREQEIEKLVQVLTSGRNAVITGISGMGGIGKSALALSVAAHLRDKYPDGQILVEMGGMTNVPRGPAEAIRLCIRALTGVEQQLPDNLTQLVQIYRFTLEGKKVLILLDNVSDVDQVRELVPPSGSTLLITSRNAISLPGITQLTLDALTPSDARELLTDIAPHVPNNIADEICALCGYIPLAIRVAASHLVERPDLGLSEFIAQLREHWRRREISGVEGTNFEVEASLTLSYQNLEAEAARVLRQLSIFPGSFDADAEETICDDKRHRRLRRLVSRHLVHHDLDTRRYELHDLARRFSDSQLTQSERQEAGERHAAHYRTVLQEAEARYLDGNTNIMAALRIFDSEWHNIWAGWSWAQRELSNNSLAIQLANEYPLVAEHLLDLRQRPREKILWAETGLRAARQLRDRRATSYHCGNLGMSLVDLGEVKRATEYFERQLALAHELDDLLGQGTALRNIGYANLADEEAESAIESFQQSLAIARKLGNLRAEGITLNALGRSYSKLRQHRRALEFYEQSIDLARKIGARRGEGKVLNNLGMSYAAMGSTERAIEYYEQSLSITRELGDRQVEGEVLFNLSETLQQRGDYSQAIVIAERALEILEPIESPDAPKVREQIRKWSGSE